GPCTWARGDGPRDEPDLRARQRVSRPAPGASRRRLPHGEPHRAARSRPGRALLRRRRDGRRVGGQAPAAAARAHDTRPPRARRGRGASDHDPGSEGHRRVDVMYRKLDVDAGREAVESVVMLAQWPAGERPRERLDWSGPDALADAELLALQLGSGMRGRSAVDVAREMLATYGSLNDLAGREAEELARVPGIGRAKA